MINNQTFTDRLTYDLMGYITLWEYNIWPYQSSWKDFDLVRHLDWQEGKFCQSEQIFVSPNNYTPHNEVVGGYADFTMSVRLSVHL